MAAAATLTPLYLAAARGDDAEVSMLLSTGKKSHFGMKDYRGWTPLHIASINGHASCVELLCKAGAELNEKDNGGGTPLYCASGSNHPSTVSILLAAGASVDSATNNSNTPLMWAAFWGHSAVVRLLLEGGANRELKAGRGQRSEERRVGKECA